MIKCVGIRKFQYTSKKTGNTYPAANIYCTEERKGVDGVAAYDLFVRQELLPADIAPGCEIHCTYNRFGSVEEVIVL